MTSRNAEEEDPIERLIRDDREMLSAFVTKLNKGVAFDDMDEDLKAWWMNRY